MTVNIIPVNVTTDTFLDLVAKVNTTIDAMRFRTVTVDSNNTIGHAAIVGSLSSNTIFVSEISGGFRGNTAPILVSSNTTFVNTSFTGTNTSFDAIGNIRVPGSNTTNKTLMVDPASNRLRFADLRAEIVLVDGAGSLIDSDLLDGQQGVWYTDIPARQGYTSVNKAGDSITGALSVANNFSSGGNVSVKTTVFSVNTTSTSIANTPAIDFNQIRLVSNTTSVPGTTATVIHQFPKAEWNTVKYTISIFNSTDSTLMATEILVISDNFANTSHSVQYGSIYSNNSFGEFIVNNTTANTRLVFTANEAKTLTVNYSATMVK